MNFFESLEGIKLGNLSLGSVLSALLLLIVSFILIRIIDSASRKLLGRSRYLPPNLKSFLGSSIKVVLWIIALLIILDSLGVSITSLVALVSVVGLALSLSVQGILGNIFSGITLLMTKPIAVGDYIVIGDSAGTVKSIGLFYTVIVTLDKKLIYLPNSDVTSTRITNYFAEEKPLVELTVSVSYACPTELMHKAVLEAAASDERILKEPEPLVRIINFGASNIEYLIRVPVDRADFWGVYLSFRETVRDSLDRNGISIDYEHLNIHAAK